MAQFSTSPWDPVLAKTIPASLPSLIPQLLLLQWLLPAIPMLRSGTSSHCPQESEPSGLTVKVPHELATGSSPAYAIVSHFAPAPWSGTFHHHQASPCSGQACLEDPPSPDSPHMTTKIFLLQRYLALMKSIKNPKEIKPNALHFWAPAV